MNTHRRHTSRRAIATAEMAILLPLLLLLSFGVIEYGWLLLKSQQVTNAARQGARVAARADATTVDVEQAILAAMSAASIDVYTTTLTPNTLEGLESGTLITVTVTVGYADVGLGMPLIPTPDAIDASMTMANEGP